MVVAVTLIWAVLVDARGWNFLVDKPPHHGKVSFIEGAFMLNVENVEQEHF